MKNYPVLHDTIKKLGNCVRPLESFWLVDTSLTLLQLNDIILKAVDSDDCYYIVPIKETGVGRLLPDAPWAWINAKFNKFPLSNQSLRPPFGKS